MLYMLFMLCGAIAGVCAGLFGVGGGLIIVPFLIFVFDYGNIGSTQLAVGTSLATIVLTGLSSARAHHLRGNVAWQSVWRLSAGLAVGAVLGAQVATRIGGDFLQALIGISAIAVAITLGKKSEPKVRAFTTPKALGGGALIGVLSALFGIGGGSLSVPFLRAHGHSMHQAVGTAAACGVPIALFGAISMLFAKVQAPLEYQIGYVYLPAFVCICVASVLCARLGARLAQKLSAKALSQAFALLLIGVGIKLIYGAVV